MTVARGWFIKSKEPNDLFWTLRPEVSGDWTTDPEKALLFARKEDAESYFQNCFHPSQHGNFIVAGVN